MTSTTSSSGSVLDDTITTTKVKIVVGNVKLFKENSDDGDGDDEADDDADDNHSDVDHNADGHDGGVSCGFAVTVSATRVGAFEFCVECKTSFKKKNTIQRVALVFVAAHSHLCAQSALAVYSPTDASRRSPLCCCSADASLL